MVQLCYSSPYSQIMQPGELNSHGTQKHHLMSFCDSSRRFATTQHQRGLKTGGQGGELPQQTHHSVLSGQGPFALGNDCRLSPASSFLNPSPFANC